MGTFKVDIARKIGISFVINNLPDRYLKETWFNKDDYNFSALSWVLPYYYSEYFDIWFDKNLYNFRDGSLRLACYCPEHFFKWFDKRLYDYEDISHGLAVYCSEYFMYWFDEEKFDFTDEAAINALEDHCLEYSDIWEPLLPD